MYKISGFKHIFVLILIAAVLVSLSAVMYWKYLDSALIQKESANLFSVSRNLAKNFDYQMGAKLKVLASVGESLEGLPRIEDKKGLMLYLARQNQRGNFEMMGFQFPDGRAYFSDGSVRQDFLSAKETADTYENNYYISAPRDMSDRGKSIITAVPVYRNGAKAGVLFASQPAVFYEQLLNCELPFGNTQWFILGQDGEVILEHFDAMYNILYGTKSADIFDLKYLLQDTDQKREGIAQHSLYGENYLVSHVPLAYNNWRLLSLRSMDTLVNRPQKQLMTALFMSVSIIIVLCLLLLFIIHGYRQHSLALYRTGFVDRLTGLGNHNYFQVNFTKSADAFRKSGTPFTLTVINISRFKAINDIYGFEQGDIILKHAAQIMRGEVKENELLCRSSADRFLLLLSCGNRDEFKLRVEKILSDIRHFCENEKLCFEIPINAGVYMADEDIPFYIMIDRANMALKSARRAGQTFSFYNDDYRKQIDNIADIESKMNAAFDAKQFKLFLQPKYNFKTGRIESAEALARWQDPQKGLITPDKFIPVFEKNGFVLKLDMYILEETVKLLARRISEGRRVVPVGVNFSRLHLEDPRFIDSLTEIVDSYSLPHEFIELEITESIAFDKWKTMRNVVDELHARGFSVAMDDFGSGYSSLNTLKDLYFDCVKLDKEFLNRGESSERMRQIISSTVEMIKKLGCLIVTEGVETKEQAEFLKNIGCDQAQGYIFSRPLPPEDFEKLLDDDIAKTE
ncbi:MAG: EAL domain-containing protein [Endomicrobia bacterium]|nr:EAL domain-containing protein [Endomicrobiia bacterium]